MGDDVRTQPLPDTQVPDTQEFFESDSQRNSLNGKFVFDQTVEHQFTAAKRSQINFDALQARMMMSMDESLGLQKKVNDRYFDAQNKTEIELAAIRAQRLRHESMWGYESAYDLGNPVTTGTGDTVRAGAVPANRVTDAVGATAGGAVDVAAAGVSTANLAVLQQILQALAALLPVSITASGGASTPSQTQAKPTA